MDAISFVLGLTSSHMRSVSLKELIHRKGILQNAAVDQSAIEEEEEVQLDEGDIEGNTAAGTAAPSASVTAVYRNNQEQIVHYQRKSVLLFLPLIKVRSLNGWFFQDHIERAK